MDISHWLLIFFWLAYCFLHSVMADSRVKKSIQKRMGAATKYYRPLYSIFAAVSLALLLWFQFAIQSPRLFSTPVFVLFPGILVSLTGLIIMIVCVNKYFYELSGLQAIQKSTITNTLQQSGLHKYIRHPLYLGTLLFIWGLFFIFPFANNLLSVMIITAYVLFGIKLEEKKLYTEYGESYKEYAKKVPKLFPLVYTIKKGSV